MSLKKRTNDTYLEYYIKCTHNPLPMYPNTPKYYIRHRLAIVYKHFPILTGKNHKQRR